MNDPQIFESITEAADALSGLGGTVQDILPILIATPFIMYGMLLFALKMGRR